MTVNILAVGDVVGERGLELLLRHLPDLKRRHSVGFTVVNGENVSGLGLTPDQGEDLLDAGADVITLGNHTFSKGQIIPYLDECPRILRPANLAPQNPGRGWGDFDTDWGPIRVVNLLGRCGMLFGPDNPFLLMDALLRDAPRLVLVDLHGEATSEKLAMAYFLDGRVSALWGTHTHVQTSDARVFPRGTGYVTDLGMTGPVESVLGVPAEQSVSMFLGDPHRRFGVAGGRQKLEGAVFSLDTETGLCLSVQALRFTE